MGTAECVRELSRKHCLSLFSVHFPNFKSEQRKLQNTAVTNDPEIAENHSKQFEFAKSLQTNTANTNEYTLCPLSDSASVKCSHGLVEVLIGAVAKHVWRNVYI